LFVLYHACSLPSAVDIVIIFLFCTEICRYFYMAIKIAIKITLKECLFKWMGVWNVNGKNVEKLGEYKSTVTYMLHAYIFYSLNTIKLIYYS